MRDRFFLWLLIFIIAGIVIGLYLPFHFYWVIGLSVLSLIILLFNRPVAVCTLVMAIVMLVSANFYFSKSQYYKDIQIEGTVKDVYLTGYGDTAVILDNCNNEETGKTKIRAYIDDSDNHFIKQGNKIRFYGNASPVKIEKGNFDDYTLQNLSDGIKYTFFVEDYEILDDSVDSGYYLAVFKENIRNIIFENIDDNESASVLYAMASGDKDYIPENVIENFKACGTSHLLAVSGLHVSIFLSLFILLLRKLKIRMLSLLIIGVLVLVYCAFTGFSSSVIRASIMALAVNLSVITGERYDSVNSLGFAGSCILMAEPYRLFDVGFQLSFLACFGIAWIMGYRRKFKPKILGAIMDAGLLSVGATIFTLPVQIYYFGTVSIISILANILIVSIASFALILVFIFVVAAHILPVLGMLLHIPGYIMTGIIKVIDVLSASPQIVFRPVPMLITVVTVVLMIFFSRFIRFKYKHIVAGILLLILPFMWIGTATYHNNYVMVCSCNGYVHIKDDKQYILGLADEKNLENQLNYIDKNIGKVDVLILLDYEDLNLLQSAVEKGFKFDKLYAARFMHTNKEDNIEIIAILKTNQGKFDFSQNPLFLCGGQRIDINNLIKEKSYEETYIRSH